MVPIHKLSGRLGNQMFQLAYIMAQVCNGEIPDIYVQDEKYFKKHSHHIKAMFGQDIKPIDQVSIHIRRTDYVGNSFYTQLWNTDYYEKAMAEFPGTGFLVFSDDIDWCKQYFSGSNDIEFCEEEDPIKAMNLMAGCKHNIISNSSFSWWAAYLNPNPHKKVIAPKAWYTDGKERTVCPKEWKRI